MICLVKIYILLLINKASFIHIIDLVLYYIPQLNILGTDSINIVIYNYKYTNYFYKWYLLGLSNKF